MSDYDAFASHFSATRQNAWPEFDLILPFISKGDRVLDLGCGNGRFRHFLPTTLVPEGYYHGVDMSQPLLDIARDAHRGDHFFTKDFSEPFPFGANNFDVVVCIAAFHHLLNKRQQKQFMAECHRVLKPKGTLFITTWRLPQKYFWSNLIRLRFKNWIIPFGKEKHKRVYRKVNDLELKELMEEQGFEVLHHNLFQDRNFFAIGRKGDQ